MESMESMMMKSVRWMVVAGGVGVALLLVMPSPRALEDPAVADPASVGMSAKRLQRLDAFIQEYIDTDQIAGAVTLVARKGKVVHFEAQGWRDKGNDVPMTRDTIFNLMSMTKPVVSTALMLLFEGGRFLLDDPIAKWLPEYADHQVRVAIDETHSHLVPEARAVTVRHVLTHTSGLTLNPNRQGLSEEQLTAVTNQGKGWPTLAEQVAHAAVIPAAFHPGDEWRYGDSTDFVAALVEKISGQSLGDFLQERLFTPLDMDDTTYHVPAEKISRVALVYQPGGNGGITPKTTPVYQVGPGMFRGVAGLQSTAADYYRFAQMIANGGELNGVRVIGRMTVDNMISNHIGAGKPVYNRGDGYGFGLGFGVVLNPAEAKDALSIGSYMWGGAYGTYYWADPVEDLIGILMFQLQPYDHLSVRNLFSNVVTQAVVDSLSDQNPKIMGYATPR